MLEGGEGPSCAPRLPEEPFQEVVIMKGHFRFLMIFAALCCLPAALMAQGVDMVGAPSSGFGAINPYNLLQKHWIVAGKVTTLGGDPVAGAKVAVQPTVEGEFRLLTTNLQGEFQTEYDLNADLVREFSVVVTTNKKGFLKAHALIDFGNADRTWAIPITLRDPNPDPELLSQADMVSALAPRLKKLGSADGLSAKSEKDYAHGVEEFLDQSRPDRALGFLTKVIARDPSCVGCRMMLGLAELASGDWDGANRNFSQGVDDVRKVSKSQAGQRTTAAPPGFGRPEPALALGVMESWRHQEDRAAGFFEEALNLAPQDPLGLQEMGRMELLLHNWGAANTYLGKAVAAGASPEARLLRAEALLDEGEFDGANQELTRYLDGRDVKTMPLRVRQLWARIGEKKKIEVVYAKVKSRVNQPLDYLHNTVPELKDLVPATDQAPLDSVLNAVGKRVEAYFRNFPNTVSLEAIHQEKLSRKGKVGGTLDQKFHYLCLTPTEESELGFTEYRANLSGDAGQPQGLSDGYMLTSGFASASLIFHPVYQAESTFRYLGRQKINGQDTFVVAFAQRPEKARLNGVFKMGETSMATFSQGLAWIDSASYEIIRLHTDLLKPLPEVRLEKETTEIDFGENHFKSIAEGFWLPREVKVSVDWNGKSLRNKHEYSDFKLFNVGATEKIGKPKELRQTSKEEPPQAPN
jgi:tetratricopeptide (TPR) repeat protein